jgi:radical SAM modification target selenobiotic family peptide
MIRFGKGCLRQAGMRSEKSSLLAYQGLSGEVEKPSRLLKERRRMMDEKQMKKFLAGLCLTGLLTGAGLTPANAQQSGQSG